MGGQASPALLAPVAPRQKPEGNMIAFIWTAGIAVLLAAGLTAAQAQAPAGPHRPAKVPGNYIVTPFGYFHPTCVQKLAEGDELRPDTKTIQHAAGSASPMHTCGFPHYRANGEELTGDERHAKTPDISWAWVEYAGVTTATSYGQLYAKWSVPPSPATHSGQTIYFFPGLEDINNTVTILQPVLGWNSDYANAWGIASWNCCVNGTVYEAPASPVNSGDTILGYIKSTCPAGTLTCSSWNVVTQDLQNGAVSKLAKTSNFGQTFNWAFGGVLEVYGITNCTDYPVIGNNWGSHAISFHEIGLFDYNLQRIFNPPWTISVTAGLTPTCGYSGGRPNQVVLNY
jgi:hypothetical protein